MKHAFYFFCLLAAAERPGLRRSAGLLLGLLLALQSPAQQGPAQQTNYPAASRIGWVNVKSYGAKGDGVTDDTRAIRRAITTYANQYLTRIVVYFPDGKYLVSDSLRERGGYYDGYVTFQGQSTQGTVIQLKDNAPGFQDPANPRPVVYVTRAGNQSFNQYFINLTINTGKGNPGAVALEYTTNNVGAVRNVNLTSGDGQGFCGLRMDRDWPGPGLIKNVTITGFQYGVRMSSSQFSMTFENLTLNHQSVVGFRNAGNEAVIRKLTSNNAVPVIETSNQLVLLDGNFTGGSAGSSAIVNTGYAYLRNTTASGYTSVTSYKGTTVPGNTLTEYSSETPVSLFPYQGGLMLNLPVKETPEYINNDTTQWANVLDYGARSADPLYGQYDSGPGIQAALNSGKPVIYFPPKGNNAAAYQIFSDITIPPTVKLIIGFGFADIGDNNGGKLVVQESSPDPLIFERLGVGNLTNTSTRTIVVKDGGVGYDNGPGSGELFLEDVTGSLTPSYAMNMWARQLNTEVRPTSAIDVLNQGGNYWVLGQKTEGQAIVNKTVNGGSSELLGGLLYPTTPFTGADTTAAALVSVDGCISAIFSEQSFGSNDYYPYYASETRNGVTKRLRRIPALYRGGCAGAAPDPAVALRTPENPTGTVAGVAYQYYTGSFNQLPDFSTLTPAATGTVATFSISPRTQDDNFAFRYKGYVTVPTDGIYTFYTNSDDGSRLYIGEHLVVNNDGLHAAQEHSGTIGLKAGTHAITVTFFELSGDQVLDVSYAGPGVSKQVILASALSSGPATATSGIVSGGIYRLSPKSAPSKCLDVAGGPAATNDGANIHQWEYYGNSNQLWKLEKLSDGYYRLIAQSSPAGVINVLDVNGCQTGSGPNVQQYRWLDSPCQHWQLTALSDGNYRLTPKSDSSSCLDVEGCQTGNGINVRQWQWLNSDCQHWSLALLKQASTAKAAKEPSARKKNAFNLTVYPNPATEQLTMQFQAATQGATTLTLRDALGRTIWTHQRLLDAGAQAISCNVRQLPAGFYLLQIEQGGQVQTQKIQIQP